MEITVSMRMTVSIRKSIGIGLTMSLIALVLSLAAIPSAHAQSALSAKGFVQSFYTWYIPQMTKNVPVPSDQRILKERAVHSAQHS